MKPLAATLKIACRRLLSTAVVVALFGGVTASSAGMIIATYVEASGETGILGTSSSGDLTGGRFIGQPPDQFNPLSYAIRGQADFLDTGVLFNEGLEASILAIGDPDDFPFFSPLTANLLGSESFANSGTAADVAAFDNPGGFFSLTTIFTIHAPTPGLLTARARITAGDAPLAVPEPTSLTLVAGALAALCLLGCKTRRRSTWEPN